MNVEIGTEAAQFPAKEYINRIFFAAYNFGFLFTLSNIHLNPVLICLFKYESAPHVRSSLFAEWGLFGQSVLTEDATNVEAIACIGMNHFYSDQPELSLRSGPWNNQL
jgi:hypothetical protein